MTYTMITHGDSDGIISAAITIMAKGESPEYFFTSSPGAIHRSLAYTVMKSMPSPLYVLDISPTQRSCISLLTMTKPYGLTITTVRMICRI